MITILKSEWMATQMYVLQSQVLCGCSSALHIHNLDCPSVHLFQDKNLHHEELCSTCSNSCSDWCTQVPSAADSISVVTPSILHWHCTALALQQTGSGPGDRMNFTVQELEQGSLGTRIVCSIQYQPGTHQRNCNLPPWIGQLRLSKSHKLLHTPLTLLTGLCCRCAWPWPC